MKIKTVMISTVTRKKLMATIQIVTVLTAIAVIAWEVMLMIHYENYNSM